MDTGDLTKSIIGVAVIVIVIVTVAIPILGQFTTFGEPEIGENINSSELDGYYYYVFPLGTDFIVTAYTVTADGEDITDGLVSINARAVNDADSSEVGISLTVGDNGVINASYANYNGGSGSISGVDKNIINDEFMGRNIVSPYIVVSTNPEKLPNSTQYHGQGATFESGDETLVASVSMYANIGDSVFITNAPTQRMIIQQALVNTPGEALSFPDMLNHQTCTVDTTATSDEAVALTTIHGYSDSNKTIHLYLLAPAEYTKVSQTPAMIEGPVAEIVDIIPLIMVVGVLIGAVGIFVYNKRS